MAGTDDTPASRDTGQAREAGGRFGIFPALACSLALIVVNDKVSDIGYVRSEELRHVQPFEYPALARPLYLLERAVSGSILGISLVNVVICTVGALLMVIVLKDMGADASLWIGAPMLVLTGQNWDVLTALTIALTLRAWQRGDDIQSGLWLGIGTAFKLVPGVLLVPLLATRQYRRVAVVAAAAAAVFVASNLPLVLRNRSAWWYPYKFAQQRTDIRGAMWSGLPVRGEALSIASALALIACLVVIYASTVRGWIDFRTACVLSILTFIVTNKVWQPHYVLWALPVLAIARIPHRPVRALEWTSLLFFAALWRKHPAVHNAAFMWTTGGLRLIAAGVLIVVVVLQARGREGLSTSAR